MAGAAANSVVHHDAVGAIDQLLHDGTAASGASAAGILVLAADERLELLAASSHTVSNLEIYQSQRDEGPCVDSVQRGEQVHADGAAAIVRRWPTTGPLIVGNGYTSVRATPLQWLLRTFGALNMFYDQAPPSNPDADRACRALADAAVLVIVTSGTSAPTFLTATLAEALHGRAVVEQAKGALSQALSLDMSAAFDALRTVADANDTPWVRQPATSSNRLEKVGSEQTTLRIPAGSAGRRSRRQKCVVCSGT